MKESSPFSLSFLVGFIFSVAVALVLFHSEFSQPAREGVPETISAAWTVPGVVSPSMARVEHLFWAGRLSSPGQVAVDPLGFPELFSRFFPGYPDSMRRDRALWRDYFSRDFDIKIASEALSTGSTYGVTVYYSWTGCMDVFRRYGADIVVFGASEVGQSLPPDMLSRLLAEKNPSSPREPRVLMCLTSASVPEAVAEMSAEMLRSVPSVGHPQWVIYGYEAMSAYVGSVFYESTVQSKSAMIDAYRRNRALGPLAAWNHRVVFPWTWNDVIRLRKVSAHLPFPLAVMRRDRAAGFGRWSILPEAISPDYLKDQGRLRLHLSAYPFQNPLLVGNGLNACEWITEASIRLKRALDAARALAPHVLLYLSPSTGDDLASAPPCYPGAVQKMISSQSGDGVVTKAGDAGEYGLDYSDFVFSATEDEDGPLWIDSVHPNIRGARKITRTIAEMISDETKKQGRN